MKIVISAEGSGLKAQASPIFGRCPVYAFIDTDTMAIESVSNPAQNAAGGAGIQAAQFVVSKGVEAVLAGNVGPNAAEVLDAAGIQVWLIRDTTVESAAHDFIAGKLPKALELRVASPANSQASAVPPTSS